MDARDVGQRGVAKTLLRSSGVAVGVMKARNLSPAAVVRTSSGAGGEVRESGMAGQHRGYKQLRLSQMPPMHNITTTNAVHDMSLSDWFPNSARAAKRPSAPSEAPQRTTNRPPTDHPQGLKVFWPEFEGLGAKVLEPIELLTCPYTYLTHTGGPLDPLELRFR